MDNALKTIVGLGNPGPEYQNTRHNAGFMVLDTLARYSGTLISEEHRYSSIVRHWRYAGKRLLLVQPLTFMNLSGRAVAKIKRVFELQSEEIMVVYDCMDLPLGRIRLRQSGSSGGHKGMESIIQSLGTNDIPRLRVGIGREQAGTSVQHVLSSWQPAEQKLFDRVLKTSAEAVLFSVRSNVAAAMNRYNSLKVEAEAGMDDSLHQANESESGK